MFYMALGKIIGMAVLYSASDSACENNGIGQVVVGGGDSDGGYDSSDGDSDGGDSISSSSSSTSNGSGNYCYDDDDHAHDDSDDGGDGGDGNDHHHQVQQKQQQQQQQQQHHQVVLPSSLSGCLLKFMAGVETITANDVRAIDPLYFKNRMEAMLEVPLLHTYFFGWRYRKGGIRGQEVQLLFV